MGISPEVEQALRELPDGEWSALVAKVRAPDAAAQLRDIAGSLLPPNLLAGWMEGRDASAFIRDDGHIDEDKVRSNMAAQFGPGVVAPQYGSGMPRHASGWGQNPTPPPPADLRNAGQIEADRRFGGTPGYVAGGHGHDPAAQPSFGAAAGLAEARRRFGTPNGQNQIITDQKDLAMFRAQHGGEAVR